MTTVGATEGMEGSGPFSSLPIDLLVSILDRVPLVSKLSFSIATCKGLRPLKHVPCLWSKLATSTKDAAYESSYETVFWINGKGLLRLARWLPDVAWVSELYLHVSKGHSVFAPDDVAAVLDAFPHVTKLSLTGQAVVKRIITALTKTDRPQLKHLLLDWGTVGVPTVLSVLRRAPHLEAFTGAQLSSEVLSGLHRVLSEARGGGTPLLTSLHQTYSYADRLTLFDCCHAGDSFPELTELVACFQLVGPAPALPSTPLRAANLRRLHIYKMSRAFVADHHDPHLSDGCLAEVVRLLVSGCPRLESLALAHGRKYVSRNDVRLMPPLPSISHVFTHTPLPPTLVMLHLQDVNVTPEDLAPCQLPNLVFLRLVSCGPYSYAAARTLCSNCPQLSLEGCVVKRTTDDRDADVIGRERNRELRHVARLYHFPKAGIQGLSLDGVLDVLERGYKCR